MRDAEARWSANLREAASALRDRTERSPVLIPFIAYLAVVTSAALLVMLYACGELGSAERVVLPLWLLVAGCCQFFAGSMTMTTVGLVLQTCLAIYLLLRWRVTL